VIAVRVREKHGVDAVPAQADLSHALGELARTKACIDQQPKIPGADKTGIAEAATGKHCEAQ
jgi:hypothetical protein